MRRSPLSIMTFPVLRHPAYQRCCVLLMIAACLPVNFTFAQSSPSVPAVEASSVSDGNMSVADEPYLVFVADEAAHLRCGPSGEDYRTDPLRHGQELEVYVETADGWLGVRPTESSFCWIPADAVKLLASSRSKQTDAIEAEVTEDKTVAWIGTNLGRARSYRWQVQLGEGEIVTILGRSERDGPDGPQMWFRIVPPSGEFRWIHRDQVVTTAEDLIAGMQAQIAEADIEFLPSGPSSIAETHKTESPLRRVSDDRPYREEVATQSLSERARELAEIRRLDEIERNIEARQRSRFDRDESIESESDSTAQMAAQQQDHDATDHDSGAHQMRSFSQRVTEGLSSLIAGREPQPVELEPSTQSSRRVHDLVPIGSGIASVAIPPAASNIGLPPDQTTLPMSAQPIESASLANTTDINREVVQTASTIGNPDLSPKTVAATAHPEFRSNESQIAITSVPRLVMQTTPAFASNQTLNNSSLNPALPPAKLRTIAATQIEEVQRSVATSTPESLPLLMSSLMARGASAPEIRLVGDAAQRFSMNELTQRARDYEALARRRDGDTVVATTTLSTPMVAAVTPTMPASGGSFVPRENNNSPHRLSSPPSAIAPVAHTQQIHVPSSAVGPAAAVTQSGLLVAVYSADPNRPPYAITDRAGRTLVYVTPAPGVDLKSHLGSEINVQGESGFLQGLDTPHVLATQAQRIMR